MSATDKNYHFFPSPFFGTKLFMQNLRQVC